MATRWKRVSRNRWFKAALTLLFVAGIICASCAAMKAANQKIMFDVLDEKDYISSREHREEIRSLLDTLSAMMNGSTVGLLDPAEILYFCSDGTVSASNTSNYTREQFQAYPIHYLLEPGSLSDDGNPYPRETIYLAFTDNYVAEKQADFAARQNVAFSALRLICLSLLAALAAFSLLCAAAGRKGSDDALHTQWIDRVYTDCLLLFTGFFCWLWVFFMLQIGIDAYRYGVSDNGQGSLLLWLVGLFSAALAGLFLGTALSFARQIKGRRLVRHTLCYQIFSKTLGFFASLFDGSRFRRFPFVQAQFRRQLFFVVCELLVLLFLALSAASANAGLMLFFLVLGVLFLVWFLRANYHSFEAMNRLLEQITAISQGNLRSTADLEEASPLYPASAKLAAIGSGLQTSLEKQMKDERMKIDLVTNVSHDLKTPLTSIISYVDLLSKEALPPEAQDYVRILAQKSNRLKNIVSDLFDLARTTSGNAELVLEILDLKKLIEQTLGDMGDRVEQASQSLKVRLPETPVLISGDGKKLYRVFQNMIDNALNYSLAGTRIFIDLFEEKGRAWATIKNTASYEMNFSPAEILERFSRGDKARTTQGSGLGLSIADSFTTACGGHFQIVIDGDQFKTIVSFPLEAPPPAPSSPPPPERA